MSNIDDQLNFGVTLDNGDEEPTERAIVKEKAKIVEKVHINQGQPQLNSLKNNQQEKMAVGIQDYDLSKASHPIACLFAIGFKISALIIYLIFPVFLPTVLVFIFVVILGALDFWVIKNISGRLLVGLRWWNSIDNDGKQILKFESRNTDSSNSVDKLFFWSGQIIFTLIWGLFLALNVMTFDIFWALLNFILFSLSSTNLYGYYKCRGQYSKKLNNLKAKGFMNIAGRFL